MGAVCEETGLEVVIPSLEVVIPSLEVRSV